LKLDLDKNIFLTVILLVAICHASFGQCERMPIPNQGNLQVTVANVNELEAALDQASTKNGIMTITLLFFWYKFHWA